MKIIYLIREVRTRITLSVFDTREAAQEFLDGYYPVYSTYDSSELEIVSFKLYDLSVVRSFLGRAPLD